jgi:hypothetical protein
MIKKKDNPKKPYANFPVEVRFAAAYVVAANGCWEWKMPGPNGYGLIRMNGKATRAHRASWMLKHSVVLLPDQYVLHKCDNRRCVNPEHLYVGDAKQNRADFVARHPEARTLMSRADAARMEGCKAWWARLTAEERSARVKWMWEKRREKRVSA